MNLISYMIGYDNLYFNLRNGDRTFCYLGKSGRSHFRKKSPIASSK
ncbi:hypothetical protein [Planktothrix agardhii]|nr:hypothetical protein [Planktothrix agardhii]